MGTEKIDEPFEPETGRSFGVEALGVNGAAVQVQTGRWLRRRSRKGGRERRRESTLLLSIGVFDDFA